MSMEFWMALAALIGFGLVVLYLVYDYRGSVERGEDVPHLCRQAKCPIDVGMWMANHVAAAHPALLMEPGELERRQLTARIEGRRN